MSDISNQDGVEIGNASKYIASFKTGGKPTSPDAIKSSYSRNSSLPTEWNDDTQKDILTHYYGRYGNGSGLDYAEIAGKMAASINRTYSQKLTIEGLLSKLDELVNLDNLPKVEYNTPRPVKAEKSIKISLPEGNYTFAKNVPKLAPDKMEFLQFVDKKNIIFSYDGISFYPTVKLENMNCFDDLFNFTPQEQLYFEMVKDQFGDENNARKLTLMSRLLMPMKVKKSKIPMVVKEDRGIVQREDLPEEGFNEVVK